MVARTGKLERRDQISKRLPCSRGRLHQERAAVRQGAGHGGSHLALLGPGFVTLERAGDGTARREHRPDIIYGSRICIGTRPSRHIALRIQRFQTVDRRQDGTVVGRGRDSAKFGDVVEQHSLGPALPCPSKQRSRGGDGLCLEASHLIPQSQKYPPGGLCVRQRAVRAIVHDPECGDQCRQPVIGDVRTKGPRQDAGIEHGSDRMNPLHRKEADVERHVLTNHRVIRHEFSERGRDLHEGLRVLDVRVRDTRQERDETRDRFPRVDQDMECFQDLVAAKQNGTNFHDLIGLRLKPGRLEVNRNARARDQGPHGGAHVLSSVGFP